MAEREAHIARMFHFRSRKRPTLQELVTEPYIESSTHKQCGCTAIYSTQLYIHTATISTLYSGARSQACAQADSLLTHCLAARWRSTKLFQVVCVPSCVRSVAQGSDTATSTETQTQLLTALYTAWLHTAPTKSQWLQGGCTQRPPLPAGVALTSILMQGGYTRKVALTSTHVPAIVCFCRLHPR